MQKQNCCIKEKVQNNNPVYREVVEQLKSGSQQILKDLRKSRRIKLCRKIQMIRKDLKTARELFLDNPEPMQMKHLVKKIQLVIGVLELTKDDLNSKYLMKIRIFAESLLKNAKSRYQSSTNNKQGGLPMGK